MNNKESFKQSFQKYWFAIITGIASGLVVAGGLTIKNIITSSILIFVFAIIMTLILTFSERVDRKPPKKQKKKKVNWWILIMGFILIIAGAYFVTLFLQWQFTLYHESGHLLACKAVNLSCELEDKSFPEYLHFINYNLITGVKTSAVMKIVPTNISEFCNLSIANQQLIRVNGFRRDLVVSFVIVSILVIELILFIWFISHKVFNKKRTSYRAISLWLMLIFFTIMILYMNLSQLQSYFSQNIGDLFYFPC